MSEKAEGRKAGGMVTGLLVVTCVALWVWMAMLSYFVWFLTKGFLAIAALTQRVMKVMEPFMDAEGESDARGTN